MTKQVSRRSVLKGAATAAAGAALAATGFPMPAIAAGVTLKLIDPWAGTTFGDTLNALIMRYMDSHPGVTIERLDVPFADFRQNLVQGAAAGDMPDIALIDNPDFHSFAALGVLADLTSEIKAWGKADFYFPGHCSSTVYQGVNHGVPGFSNCLAWWINSDMKSEAGVSTPTSL